MADNSDITQNMGPQTSGNVLPTPVVPGLKPQQVPTVQPPPQAQPEAVPEAPQSGDIPFYKLWSFWVTLFLFFNLAVIGYLWAYPLLSPPIIVENQPIDASFEVKKTRVPTTGNVAIQLDVDGSPGTLMASSRLLIPDTYTNFNLPLLGPDDLPPEALAVIRPGSPMFVTLYKDSDGDGIFNPNIDTEIVTDILGRKVQAKFTITSTP